MLHTTQREVVDRVFSFHKQRVADYMRPRSEIVWLDLNAGQAEWRRIARTSEYSRLPVGRQTVSSILGSVGAKDIVAAGHLDAATLEAMAMVRPTLVLLESVLILTAFERFREAGVTMALVVDEYGELLGCVTSTDLLRSFIGDLPDGSPSSLPVSAVQASGSWTLDGMLPVTEAQWLLEITDLPPRAGVRYHTLAGMVTELLKTLPRHGDQAIWQDKAYTVTRMVGRRVDQVLVRQIKMMPEPPLAERKPAPPLPPSAPVTAFAEPASATLVAPPPPRPDYRSYFVSSPHRVVSSWGKPRTGA